MTAQKPAQGILLVNSWGSSKMYKVVCECGSDECSHDIDIEAEDTGVTVTIYTKTKTNFWSKTRWHHIWTLLTKGYIDFETAVVMNKQVALNYASVLQLAVKDVEELRNARQNQRSNEHPQ